MIYIDGNSQLQTLVRVWTKDRSDIEIGYDIGTVRRKVQERIPILLILPWCHIQKDIHARLTPESHLMINAVKQAIDNHLCIIIGGSGEIEYFGNSVITDLLTMKLFLRYLALLEKKQ